jgi:hypothetical protein
MWYAQRGCVSRSPDMLAGSLRLETVQVVAAVFGCPAFELRPLTFDLSRQAEHFKYVRSEVKRE